MNEKFLTDGFVILPDVVPPDQLDSLRDTVDELVERHRAVDESWDTNPTPRVDMGRYVDAETDQALRFVLGETTLGVSTQLLGCSPDSVALSSMSVLCNPEFEPDAPPPSGQSWGTDPRNWHRDIRPDHDAPLSALLADEQANGPAYTQWNIALYDDSILHLIPGSHRRLTSEVERTQLREEGGTRSRLSGSLRAELKPGSGVVYNSMLLHWGSKYSNRQKRRTVHLGYRSFGRIIPTQRDCALTERICNILPKDTSQQRAIERSFALYRKEFNGYEEAFRAVVAGDADRFHAALAHLHPAKEGRLTCIILLSRLARNVNDFSGSRDDQVRLNSGTQAATVEMQQQLTSRFTPTDIDQLWARFGKLDASLRATETTHVSGFLGPPTNYLYEQLPTDLSAESAVATLFTS